MTCAPGQGVPHTCATIQKNPCAHKKIIGTSPPKKKPQIPPPKTRNFMDMAFSCRKNAFFPGAHKIGAAISGPKIADKKIYGHEDVSELWVGTLPRKCTSPFQPYEGQGGAKIRVIFPFLGWELLESALSLTTLLLPFLATERLHAHLLFLK